MSRWIGRQKEVKREEIEIGQGGEITKTYKIDRINRIKATQEREANRRVG